MKVSLITVTYNSESTIRDTLQSVFGQKNVDVEYIIIDGKSSDNTLSIIEEYRDQISVFVSEKDKGIYDAMNKGISLATGDIVGILNSDDVFYDDYALSKIVAGFDESTEGVYADLIYVNQYDLAKLSRVYSSKGFKQGLIRYGFMIPHPTFYVRRDLFEQHGNYRLDFKIAADFELMARFMKAGVTLKRIPHYIVRMREGGASSSSFGGRLKQNMEIVNACRINGIYTNPLMISLKIPFKLLSYLKKP